MSYLNVRAAEINFLWYPPGNQLRLKLTQSPTGVGVEVGTELGNREIIPIFSDTPTFETVK